MSIRRMILSNAMNEKTIEGTLPLSVYARKNVSASDYLIFGNSENTENEVVGVGEKTKNLWDEEWEVGAVSVSGSLINSTTRIRPKNYIKVEQGKEYYIYCGYNNKGIINIIFYENEGDTKSSSFYSLTSSYIRTFVVPSGSNYIKFSFEESVGYGEQYRNDVCINESDPSFNGAYEPFGYKIPVVDTHGGEVSTFNVYLKSPLKKVGDVADYIDFERGVVVRNVGSTTEEPIELPTLSLSQGLNTIDTDTTVKPYKIKITASGISSI